MRKDEEEQPTEGEREDVTTAVARRLTDSGTKKGIYGVKGGRTRGGGIAPAELAAIREQALKKVAEGRNHELTTLEAGSLGGSLNRDLYSVIHRIAANTGMSVTKVVETLMTRAGEWENVIEHAPALKEAEEEEAEEGEKARK